MDQAEPRRAARQAAERDAISAPAADEPADGMGMFLHDQLPASNVA